MGLKRTLLGVVGGMVVVVLFGSAPALAGQVQADLSIVKTGPASVSPGSNVSFTLTATNSGPGGANGVTLSDTLPTGVTFVSLAQNTGPSATLTTPAVGGTGTVTATWVTLANAASASFTLTVNVSAGFSGDLLNTATITASGSFDPNTANNSSTATVSGTTSTTPTTTSTTTTMSTTPTSTTPTSTTTTAPAAALAVTGGGSTATPIAAVALLFAGVLITLASRRRIAGR